ncbi:MAG: hypothetical protein ACK4TA_15295 [Saprospiraceae bacterium]
MRTLTQPVFLLLALAFSLHQLLQKVWHLPLPWLDNYLDSLICMPVLLNLLLAERRCFFQKGDQYRLTNREVILALALLSFLFEFVFPKLSAGFTADFGDILAYSIGGCFFYYFLNQPLVEKAEA